MRYIWQVVRQVRLSAAEALLRVEVTLGYLMIVVVGIGLALQRFGGFYWVAAGVFVLFISTLSIVWRLMVSVAEEQP